ncbi:PRC-barrel domain-containing protein [Sedimentitalea nanhaiensis]|uniref:PRC-barrel domain-containing protein n=1 Tax=Sedimentitalea nanhaiensis TaxID=999627 RepID=A0A1I6X5X2_9RHOB|nr:PRC-barrel domain-containing protein [Sedimentitalea nanhaiensis]SFT33281.1 PRC-barrel domain-containing protein [Sedimentitalea nanhaiensis]
MKNFLTTTAVALALALPAYAAQDEVKEQIKDTASEAATAVENTADKVGETVAETADKVGETVAETADKMTPDTDQSMVQPPAIMPAEGYAVVEPATVTVEELEGARVYDANNEWIGEISKIIAEPSGQITTLVVDVGGFLGIGEKPVALNFDSFRLFRADDGKDLKAHVSTTQEELENMPEYES